MTTYTDDSSSGHQQPSTSPSSKSISSETATPKLGSRRKSSCDSLPSQAKTKEIAAGPDRATRFSFKQSHLPEPLPGYRCPLFCCFYAEFDIKVGPKICYQSPSGFMEQQIDITVERIEDNLDQSFTEIHKHPNVLDRSSLEGLSDSENSIFDSCSEYIITGSELTGKLINLSTNHLHILSCPTMISNERYERNSLLFSVGFILRRTEDSRPFRPLLNRWALTLRDLELECNYLSTPSKRPMIQQHLERLLVSLNSPTRECNLLLNEANLVNLKLFHPPKVPTAPVPEYAVPIFLRRDRQMHMYDWDLAINWVSLHIDGVNSARQISIKAEVDMEMVLSCLRVLKHHGVIALVDMFFFTNRYECCPVAATLLRQDSKFLDAAAMFVVQQYTRDEQQSPSNRSVASATNPYVGQGKSPSSLPSSLEQLQMHGRPVGSFIQSGRDPTKRSSYLAGSTLASGSPHAFDLHDHRQLENFSEIKAALMELYLLCTRQVSVSEIWINILTGHPPQTKMAIDWKAMFQTIDHRRFTSFGVVHGLLRRLHNFPLLLDVNIAECAQVVLGDAYEAGGEIAVQDREGRPASRHWHPRGEEQRLRYKIRRMMDGRNCDDALVCTFDMPLCELLEMIDDKAIVSTYAPSS